MSERGFSDHVGSEGCHPETMSNFVPRIALGMQLESMNTPWLPVLPNLPLTTCFLYTKCDCIGG